MNKNSWEKIVLKKVNMERWCRWMRQIANRHLFFNLLYIYIYILWRVGCLPLIISISPSLNRRPSPGSRREWVCERGGALKTARSGGVWWGTPEVNGASSPPLLYAECASPLETGLFPVHAHWCPRGSRKGALRERVPPKARAAGPAVRTRTAPARRLTGQDAGPDPPGAGPFLLEHCPSFTNLAARRGHQIPCLFWTL